MGRRTPGGAHPVECERCGDTVAKGGLSAHKRTEKCRTETAIKAFRDRGLRTFHPVRDVLDRAGVPYETGPIGWQAPVYGQRRGVRSGTWVSRWVHDLFYATAVLADDAQEAVMRRANQDEEFRAAVVAVVYLCESDPARVRYAVERMVA